MPSPAEINYTLLSDGSSDRALIPILTWLLRDLGVASAITPYWADLRRIPKPPRTLADRMRKAVELFPCQLLFVHRDAERELPESRRIEIHGAVQQAFAMRTPVPTPIAVVPVKMHEAWLLFNESAIRLAAGNPNVTHPLDLPQPSGIERVPDPKQCPFDTLKLASGRRGRRLDQFYLPPVPHRLAELTTDFAHLRDLPAFRVLEGDLRQVLQDLDWIN
jgi:hypothetical protein